jgi:hypothetical protein
MFLPPDATDCRETENHDIPFMKGTVKLEKGNWKPLLFARITEWQYRPLATTAALPDVAVAVNVLP